MRMPDSGRLTDILLQALLSRGHVSMRSTDQDEGTMRCTRNMRQVASRLGSSGRRTRRWKAHHPSSRKTARTQCPGGAVEHTGQHL